MRVFPVRPSDWKIAKYESGLIAPTLFLPIDCPERFDEDAEFDIRVGLVTRVNFVSLTIRKGDNVLNIMLDAVVHSEFLRGVVAYKVFALIFRNNPKSIMFPWEDVQSERFRFLCELFPEFTAEERERIESSIQPVR